MKMPVAVVEVFRAKRSGVALLVLALGLLALPASFTASGIYYRLGSPASWRPTLDYFELLAAVFGLLCCIIAPFLLKISVARRIFLSLAAVAIYICDLGFSAVAGIVVFGLPI